MGANRVVYGNQGVTELGAWAAGTVRQAVRACRHLSYEPSQREPQDPGLITFVQSQSVWSVTAQLRLQLSLSNGRPVAALSVF
ncbi:hypothetical protein J6590_054486 [Homalodisca vitripennis]|nr:hypothetical protein J6590_054486 [Homalodisca vitripennis]